MNCGYNNYGCGCNSCTPSYSSNPFGCGGCSGQSNGCGFSGQGSSWFAIVLVVFLLLIICGCTRMHG